MQRVRTFLVYQRDISEPLGRRLPITARASRHATLLQGWHQSWDVAVRWVHENPGIEVVIADDQGSLQVICIFSKCNLECSDESGQAATRWKSFSLPSKPDAYWCNLNYSDFGWGWVSGAEREVPFRLRFFERNAKANPNGIVSRANALIEELRDWVYGPGKKIG